MSHPYQIEDGIPIPKSGSGRPASAYGAALQALEVGQSFLIPSHDLEKNTANSVYTLAKRRGYRITVRQLNVGLRVWRVA